jgi:lysozyme family protein
MSDLVDWFQKEFAALPSAPVVLAPPVPVTAPPIAVAPTAPLTTFPDNFPVCVAWILTREGGFVDNPNDAGKATNMGITAAVLAAWRGAPVTTDDVRGLTVAEATQIYRANYWNKMQCAALPAGVDLSILDPGVMSGPSRGIKFLQGALGVKQDGAIGKVTLGAVAAFSDVRGLIQAIANERDAFYAELAATIPSDVVFLTGWRNRAQLTMQRALDMVPA